MENNIDRLCVINLVLLCVLFFVAGVISVEVYGLPAIFIASIPIILWLFMLRDKNFRCHIVFCILNTFGFLYILNYVINDYSGNGDIALYILYSQIAFFFVFFIKHWVESNRS